MKHPKHPAAAAAAVDEDLISLLMNDPLLLCERLLRQTALNSREIMQKNVEDLRWDVTESSDTQINRTENKMT